MKEKSKLEERLDYLDQNNKLSNLRIFNFKEMPQENTRLEIIKLLNAKLSLNLNNEDIQLCYRIGKRVENKDTGILLILKEYKVKQMIYGKKGSGVVIREGSHKYKVTIMNRLIGMLGLKNVWTENGKIYAAKDNNIVTKLIKAFNALQISNRTILSKKTELFEQFGPTITKDTRRKAWSEVRDYAVSIGLLTSNRDTTYMRDTTWQNLRGRTIAKLDKQTGGPGGPDKKLDETDLLIIEILGKDSPVIKGFGVPDSMGIERTVQDDLVPSITDPSSSDLNETDCMNNTTTNSLLPKPELHFDSQRSKKGTKFIGFTTILSKKTELFEQFGPTITKDTRRKAWSEVRDYAVSIGLLTSNRDTTYVRDTTWQNLRGRTMAKLDKQTGGPGGPDKKLDETDLLIIEILGKDSPVIKGFGVPDSMGIERTVQDDLVPSITDPSSSDLNETDCMNNTTTNSLLPKPELHFDSQRSKKDPRKRLIVQMSDITKEQELLKKRKLQLEVRKLEIDIWEKENAAGLKHCDLTNHIERASEPTKISEQSATQVVLVENPHYQISEDGQIVFMQENNFVNDK
nr:unnamed protein product [Callosobruchus analis]